MSADQGRISGSNYYDEKSGAVVPIQRSFGNPASIGDNALVAAPGAGKKVRLLAAHLHNAVATAQTAIFRSAANAKSGSIVFGAVANGQAALPLNEAGWLDTNDNEALNLNLSAATAVGITFVYAVIPA